MIRAVQLGALAFTLLFLTSCGTSSLAGKYAPSGSDYRKSVFQEQVERSGKVGDLELPGTTRAHYNFMRGELALQHGDFDAALEFFQEAVQYEPGPAPMLRTRLAQLLIRSGKLSEALEQLKKAGENNDNRETQLLRAGVYSSLGKNEEAAETYEALLEDDPENQEFYVLLSSLYMKLGDKERATATLERLIEVQPTSPFGYYYLARLLERAGDTSGRSLELYRKAVSLNPSSEAMQLDFARVLALQGKSEEAIEVGKQVLARNPRSAPARQLLGHLFWRGKRLDEAITELEALRSLEDDPNETRLKIALIKMERKDFVGAETELSLILATNPDHPSARYFLASAYVGQGRAAEALRALKEVDATQKMFVEAKTLEAYLERRRDNFDGAERALKEALKERPQDLELLLYLASIQREGDNLEGAIDTYERVVEVEQDSDQYYFSLGVLYDEAGQSDKVRYAMEKAIELNPKNAVALNYLGYSLSLESEDLDYAESLVKRALEIEPNNGYYMDSLGWIYYKKGRFEDAYHYIAKALEFEPTDAVILEHFGEIQVKLGLRKEALATLQSALEHAPESDDEEVGPRVKDRIEEIQRQIDAP